MWVKNMLKKNKKNLTTKNDFDLNGLVPMTSYRFFFFFFVIDKVENKIW